MFLFFSCATKKVAKNETTSRDYNLDKDGKLIVDSNPFYPLQESMMDIQNQIIGLKSKVIEYESRIHAPKINMALLKLVQAPNLKHEIIMKNGTIIQGTIIFENTSGLYKAVLNIILPPIECPNPIRFCLFILFKNIS